MVHLFIRRRLTALLLVAAPLLATAQTTPQIAKVSTTRSFSTFLFGSTTYAKRSQLLLPAARLTGAVAAGTISRLYFMYAGSNSANTLTDLTITLSQTPNTSFVGNAFYPGDTVLRRASYAIAAGTAGDWFAIDIDSGFAFDPAESLVIGISFEASANQVFGTYGDNALGANAGLKLIADSTQATTGDPSSGTWQHAGFDLRPMVGLPTEEVASSLSCFPNPAADRLTITEAAAYGTATLTLTDALGRTVRHETVGAPALRAGTPLPVRDLPAGPYVLTVQHDGRRLTRRVSVTH